MFKKSQYPKEYLEKHGLVVKRKFNLFHHFLGWWSMSLGFSIDLLGPHIEFHIPTGFIRIGWVQSLYPDPYRVPKRRVIKFVSEEERLKQLEESRKTKFVHNFYYIGWWEINLGLHFDPGHPHVQIYLPTGYFQLGWDVYLPDRPLARTFGIDERKAPR